MEVQLQNFPQKRSTVDRFLQNSKVIMPELFLESFKKLKEKKVLYNRSTEKLLVNGTLPNVLFSMVTFLNLR